MAELDEIFRRAAKFLIGEERGAKSRIARAAGIPASYLSAILGGLKPGTEDVRRKIAAALGYPGPRYEEFLQIGRNILAGKGPYAGNLEFPSDEELAVQGFMKVGFSAHMKLAAGGGGTIPLTDQPENSKVVVHRASLGKGAYRSHQLQAFRVGGDSMEPLIANGGIVLADLTQNELSRLKEGAIYVLCWDLYDGECAVKYLRWAKKNRLLSVESEDAKNNQPVFKDVEEVQLIGRVIWSWREH